MGDAQIFPDFAYPSSAPKDFSLARTLSRDMEILFGSTLAPFRSREQEEEVWAVLRGDTPVTIVLSIGGGKSLLATLFTMVKIEGVSIFVAPFRALVDNII
ncbi:hypothetical protein RBB50_004961 [Rhinocladiella similis]